MKEYQVDWSKVPKFTLVQVKDKKDEEWENRYLLSYKKDDNYPFLATPYSEYVYGENKRNANLYEECKLHPTVEIKHDWLILK